MEFDGEIRLDGRDIKTVPRRILRAHITTLTQDGVELKGTVRLNVWPFGAPAPADDEVVATLDRVGLWAHLQRHGGLTGDAADARLSHGQKQLLGLARALLHQATRRTRLVLVDEAASALDPRADERVRDVMAAAWADCTVLTIAHQREGALDLVDRALELDSGHVMELRLVTPEPWSDNF